MAKIQFTTPEGASGEVELTSERMSIGRADDNSIAIGDASISSHHAEIAIEGDAWVLTDLGSTNGTKVRGERVERIEMTSGGKFTLGSVECVFVGDESSYSSAPGASFTTTTGGYNSRPYDRGFRTGFGEKQKSKGDGAGALMGLGILALLACAASVFFIMQMGA